MSRSDSTRESWTNPAIRAARSTQTRVTIQRETYRSIGAALAALALPTTHRRALRTELKQTGSATLDHEGVRFPSAGKQYTAGVLYRGRV